jgi:hypothetical protein
VVNGEVQVARHLPARLVRALPARAAYDPRTNRLALFDQEPNLGPPTVSVTGPRTRLVLPLATPLEPSVVSSRRSRFLVDVGGGVLAAVPGDSLTAQGLMKSVRFRREPGGVLIRPRPHRRREELSRCRCRRASRCSNSSLRPKCRPGSSRSRPVRRAEPA